MDKHHAKKTRPEKTEQSRKPEAAADSSKADTVTAGTAEESAVTAETIIDSETNDRIEQATRTREAAGDGAVNPETDAQAGAAASQEPKEGDMTETTARKIEVDEDEMLFTRRKVKNLEDENKKLNNELEALKDRLLRLSSEYENFRKRTSKEKEEIGADSTVEVLREVLPVIDNLERALITETDDLQGLKDGVQMTLDQFVTALDKMGVEPISTEDGFDPHYHEAVMHEVDESKGERVVSEVFLKGYKKDDKVVRHAVVKVAN